ncbi:Alpha-mannosidase I MNS4 [Gracilariopsis chorda]|uniref:alpha-1,2-Mannosidase n=1 Tax=Gracilariopsis chorda TaxID=448386 RepID=A0A2V3IGE2_9FLOR|nr:Alpha-mannosidase I MNS4 [Gracilariopsis chorda]|eukprot:PXF41122.1 Alpha-mannosidase I MNS4 [Gracilariopsis chorda]
MRVLLLLAACCACATAEISIRACAPHDNALLTHRVLHNFEHAYRNYKLHALHFDQLRPLSCSGEDSFGGLHLSLVDTLDTLFIVRDYFEFVHAAKFLVHRLSFDLNSTVSLFEINIRVLGALLSAHGLVTEGFEHTRFDAWLWWPSYDDGLLYLAYQLAERLMPAFHTPTGIPYGAIHLQHGVSPNESIVASTAGAGSLLLEFGTLSRFTRLHKYYRVAFRAMEALHVRAASTGLVGNHINIVTGVWVATDAGVGALIDSFYEYMLKGYILFADQRLLRMHQASYDAVRTYVRKGDWFLNSDMWTGHPVSSVLSSLSAFYPGFMLLHGEVDHAVRAARAQYTVWRKYACLPEGYDVLRKLPVDGQVNYPLRPELAESVFYLHWATADPAWIAVADAMLQSIERTSRVQCGFAQVHDVTTMQLNDLMDSFLMSETFKYLYLIFQGDDHWIRNGAYVFTTEAHPLFISPHSLDIPGVEPPSTIPVKCPRRPRAERLLHCGYGMQGTDYPTLTKKNIVRDRVDPDVAMQVNHLVEHHGVGVLHMGSVFLSDDEVYRVMKVHDNEIVFARLDDRESEIERFRQANVACSYIRGTDLIRGLCRWHDT